jgi:hypothetical protein
MDASTAAVKREIITAGHEDMLEEIELASPSGNEVQYQLSETPTLPSVAEQAPAPAPLPRATSETAGADEPSTAALSTTEFTLSTGRLQSRPQLERLQQCTGS